MDTTQSVWKKYWAILNSVRFHQLAIAFVLLVLAHYGKIDTWLASAIAGFLGTSVFVGTVDGFKPSQP